MLDKVVLLFYRFPAVWRACGKMVYGAAGLALVLGAYLQVGKVAASSMLALGKQQPVLTTASQLLPSTWTWWIPESAAGLVFYLLVGASGAALALAAKQAQRQLRAI
jgi:hypothetical protein